MASRLRVDASRPYRSLLLLLAAFTPGPGYDTSTTLIQWNSPTKAPLPAVLEMISIKLTRWDAIYYTHAANRGYIFEQEWAFGYGCNRLIHVLASGCRKLGILDYAFNESLVGISISHAAHGLSVIVLYHLVCTLFPGAQGRNVALLAACLHVVSPAGAFLSAPCAESAHALLSFCGSLLFVRSFASSSSSSRSSSFQDAQLVLAGVLYGLATTFRSNGLLNGIPLLEEAVRQLVLLMFQQRFSPARLRRLLAVGTAGLCTGLGFVLPQYIAYREFCTHNKEPRGWCRRTLPCIYSFVQDHYWDNGFLRYWTIFNIPLFGLAAPMLAILLASGWQALTGELRSSLELPCAKVEKLRDSPQQARVTDRLLRSLAVPQVVIAVLTFFNHHVQIITRMASGYPIWYVWVACLLLQRGSGNVLDDWYRRGSGRVIVNYMVVYALVQGVLYASFLPPA
ncbi:GPI mannosyltransferase 2 [Aspergillus uvarum CBS 121591]|uniref:GPI mannosyltransferase 2 n=1 Tax=Aspergillus uvarum CBS 121591 TaxID=1448315 RepID=A0A319C5E3_9EURO|nr:GPI mannosyltransferase 2 [Aspergillus uvarum CBS 121591]PYH79177.1 GPI mannosyltransferase 2 [Aspergillus uvarum CBS 121591]